MKIKLEYNNVTITFEAKGFSRACDSIVLAGELIDKAHELNYGNPQVSLDAKDLKPWNPPKKEKQNESKS